MTRILALLAAAALTTLAACSSGDSSPAGAIASSAASGGLATIGAKCGLAGGAVAQDGNSALAGSHDEAACLVQQLGAPETVTTAMRQSTSKGEQTWSGGSVRWSRDGDWGRYAVALPGTKLPDVEDAASSDAPASPSPTASAATEALLTKDEVTATVKITEKHCFGSAGCNVKYEVRLATDKVDPPGTYDVTYDVEGLEDAATETITVTDGKYNQVEQSGQTERSSDKLTAKVTEVSKRG